VIPILESDEAMATVLKIGPCDHGRPMTLDEFMAGDYEEGYKYELIDGMLYVSPEPNLPEDWVTEWVGCKLMLYSREQPEVINYVSHGARVFVPGRPGVTCPEPDLAAYQDFPRGRGVRKRRWQDFSPMLVVEILSANDPDKDLVRNVELYLLVPSIKEYWVFDAREDPDEPTLTIYRRRGKKWHTLNVGPTETYTTKLLPGFELTLDSHI
jgi:Uma2 family endonuclease